MGGLMEDTIMQNKDSAVPGLRADSRDRRIVHSTQRQLRQNRTGDLHSPDRHPRPEPCRRLQRHEDIPAEERFLHECPGPANPRRQGCTAAEFASGEPASRRPRKAEVGQAAGINASRCGFAADRQRLPAPELSLEPHSAPLPAPAATATPLQFPFARPVGASGHRRCRSRRRQCASRAIRPSRAGGARPGQRRRRSGSRIRPASGKRYATSLRQSAGLRLPPTARCSGWPWRRRAAGWPWAIGGWFWWQFAIHRQRTMAGAPPNRCPALPGRPHSAGCPPGGFRRQPDHQHARRHRPETRRKRRRGTPAQRSARTRARTGRPGAHFARRTDRCNRR